MKQINIDGKRAVDLLEQVVRLTKESETDAVTHALELYLDLEAYRRADATIAFVREKIHPNLEPGQLGCAEQEGTRRAVRNVGDFRQQCSEPHRFR